MLMYHGDLRDASLFKIKHATLAILWQMRTQVFFIFPKSSSQDDWPHLKSVCLLKSNIGAIRQPRLSGHQVALLPSLTRLSLPHACLYLGPTLCHGLYVSICVQSCPSCSFTDGRDDSALLLNPGRQQCYYRSTGSIVRAECVSRYPKTDHSVSIMTSMGPRLLFPSWAPSFIKKIY